MKNAFCFLLLLIILNKSTAQNVGIGTSTPAYKLDVAGTARFTGAAVFYSGVGIGTTDPDYSLDVVGTIRSYFNGYFAGMIGIGTTNPAEKLHVLGNALFDATNPTIQLKNSGVDKGFLQLAGDNLRIGTNSSNDLGSLVIRTNGADRVYVGPTGNVGIGTASPSQKLDVAGNVVVDGTIAVNGNKGVLYNAAGTSQLKYYTRTAAFTAVNLAPHGITAEGSIGFSTSFTSPPQVIVGDITTTGGTTGPLFKCQLVIYDVTTTGCKCRISNTSNATINQDITWNIICIGN